MDEFDKALGSFLLDLNGDGVPDAIAESGAKRAVETVPGGLDVGPSKEYEPFPVGQSLKPFFGGHNPVEEVYRQPVNSMLNLAEGMGGAMGASMAAPVNALRGGMQDARSVAGAIDDIVPSGYQMTHGFKNALEDIPIPHDAFPRVTRYAPPIEDYIPAQEGRQILNRARENPNARAIPGVQGVPRKDIEIMIREAQMEMLTSPIGLSPQTRKILRAYGIDAEKIKPNALNAYEAARGGRQPPHIRYGQGRGAFEKQR